MRRASPPPLCTRNWEFWCIIIRKIKEDWLCHEHLCHLRHTGCCLEKISNSQRLGHLAAHALICDLMSSSLPTAESVSSVTFLIKEKFFFFFLSWIIIISRMNVGVVKSVIYSLFFSTDRVRVWVDSRDSQPFPPSKVESKNQFFCKKKSVEKPIEIEIKQRELTTQLSRSSLIRLFYLLIKITDSLISCIYHRARESSVLAEPQLELYCTGLSSTVSELNNCTNIVICLNSFEDRI